MRRSLQYTQLRWNIFHFRTNRRNGRCPICDNADIFGWCWCVYKSTHLLVILSQKSLTAANIYNKTLSNIKMNIFYWNTRLIGVFWQEQKQSCRNKTHSISCHIFCTNKEGLKVKIVLWYHLLFLLNILPWSLPNPKVTSNMYAHAQTVTIDVGENHYKVSRSLIERFTDSILVCMTSELWLGGVETKLQANIYRKVWSVPRKASAATWARARARGARLSRTHQHTDTCPLKGLRDPEEMAME